MSKNENKSKQFLILEGTITVTDNLEKVFVTDDYDKELRVIDMYAEMQKRIFNETVNLTDGRVNIQHANAVAALARQFNNIGTTVEEKTYNAKQMLIERITQNEANGETIVIGEDQ